MVYDSDGNIVPHFDGVENEPSGEEMIEREEEELPKSMTEVQSSSSLSIIERESAPAPVLMEDMMIQMKVDQVKKQLRMRGLKVKGKKVEFLQ